MNKALYVDDDELNRIIFTEMLRTLRPNVELDVYSSAAEVIACDVQGYDVIFSDIAMPEMNGFELYDVLRKVSKYNKPIIAVTALAISGDKEKILMHGFDAYISKPIEMDYLIEVLNVYL